MTGHTVSTGGGALDDLEELDSGDSIRVRSAGASTAYAVESVEIYAKGDLTERAEVLFDQSVRGRLVVVTCEDWNGSIYLSNAVVIASKPRPAPRHAAPDSSGRVPPHPPAANQTNP